VSTSGLRPAVKRALDVGLSALGLTLTAPLQLAAAVAVFATLGPPVLFRQTRPGLHGRPFQLLKFRTMRDARECGGRALSETERLTKVGRVLRAASIDELPQLWNVIRGDMSLVGPRPLLMQYLSRYTAQQARRHDVKPGITGWAQVNGRNALTWEQKFAFDVWYVDHWSLLLDVKILAMTVARVLQRQGITNSEALTMPEFMGSGGAAQ
jgi:sugar transferase EpsL